MAADTRCAANLLTASWSQWWTQPWNAASTYDTKCISAGGCAHSGFCKQLQKLGRRVATAHLLQLTLMFWLGAVLKSQHMTAPGQLRAVFAIFGIIYALQVTAAQMLPAY